MSEPLLRIFKVLCPNIPWCRTYDLTLEKDSRGSCIVTNRFGSLMSEWHGCMIEGARSYARNCAFLPFLSIILRDNFIFLGFWGRTLPRWQPFILGFGRCWGTRIGGRRKGRNKLFRRTIKNWQLVRDWWNWSSLRHLGNNVIISNSLFFDPDQSLGVFVSRLPCLVFLLFMFVTECHPSPHYCFDIFLR